MALGGAQAPIEIVVLNQRVNRRVVFSLRASAPRKKGLLIDQKGSGMAYYQFAKPDGSTNLGPEAKRQETIRSTQAGFIAQEKFYLRFYDRLPPSGACHDIDGINALVQEMHTGRNLCEEAKGELSKESLELVEKFWQAIEALAQTLLSKQWENQAPPSSERRWSTQMWQKALTGDEVVAVLDQLHFETRAANECSGSWLRSSWRGISTRQTVCSVGRKVAPEPTRCSQRQYSGPSAS